MNIGDRVTIKTDKNSRNIYVENEKTKKMELLMLHSVDDPDYEADIEDWEYMLETINRISFQKFKLVIVTPQ